MKINIKYLGHSGWLIKFDNYSLVFDYYLYNGGYKLLESDLGKWRYFFVSHNHHDHFDENIFEFDSVNTKYIYGWDYSGKDGLNIIPGETFNFSDNFKIYTHKSTDAGSGFMLDLEGIRIYHGGDHANWEDNEPGVSFEGEIDKISRICDKVDFAFLPGITYSGACPRKMFDGIKYSIEKLNPKKIFLMHGINKEKELVEIQKKLNDDRVIVLNKPGDEFKLDL